MNRPPEHADDAALQELARVGLLAAHVGEPSAARAIFSSLVVLRPDSVLPYIGLALAEQAAGRMDEAIRLLCEDGLKAHPGDGQLSAFLGLALVQANRPSQAASVLNALLATAGAEGEHVRMARGLLSQLGLAAAIEAG